MDLHAIIANSYLAQGLSQEFIGKIAAIAEMREFKSGDEMVREDDDCADLMILAEGRAFIKTEMSEDYIGIIKSPMPFGEVSFIDHKRRSSSVIADTDCSVVILPELPLRQLMADEPEMAVRALLNLSRVLCDRLRKANQQIAALNVIEEFNL